MALCTSIVPLLSVTPTHLVGDVCTIIADTGFGKTALAVGIWANARLSRKRVIYAAANTLPRDFRDRVVSHASGVAFTDIRSSDLSQESTERLVVADRIYSSIACYSFVLENTLKGLIDGIEKLCDLGAPDMIVIDQTNEIETGREYGYAKHDMETVMNALKQMAVKHKTSVIATVHSCDGPIIGEDQHIMVKELDMIKRMSDSVVCMHHLDNRRNREVQITATKSRSGELRSSKALFFPEIAQMCSSPESAPRPSRTYAEEVEAPL